MLNIDYATQQKIRDLPRSVRLADILTSHEISFLRGAVSEAITRAYDMFGESAGHRYEHLSDVLSDAHQLAVEDDQRHIELGMDYD